MIQTVSHEEAVAIYEHFDKNVQDDEAIVSYATERTLKSSRYIFVTNNALKQKKGYCTHCHSRFLVEGEIKQNASCECPKCLSKCQYKKAWLGRKYMVDSGQFIWFEKSASDPNVVIASCIKCSRSYNESYENVQTKCTRTMFCIFKMGGSEGYEIWNWKDCLVKPGIGSRYKGIDIAVSSIKNAVEGTPFQYSGWEVYASYRWIEYLALFSVAPNLEVLSKNGFKHIVTNKIDDKPSYGAINWEARKLHDFFDVSKHEFNKMKNADVTGLYVMHAPNFAFGLWMWQKALREKSQMTYEEVIAACNTFNLSYHYKNFVKVKKYSTMHRLFNYMKKQFERDSKHYRNPSDVLITWADHIRDLELLEMDLKNDVVIFPKDLRKAHQQTHKLVTIKKDSLADLKMKKRNKKLESLMFEADGLIIRPPESFDEIIKEGKALDHCVSRYADGHSTGSKTIMFIRKKSALDIPFYTVELSGKRVVQVRGLSNKVATKQVERFMKRFEEFLKQPKKRKKERETA